jgi:hypothetical protein
LQGFGGLLPQAQRGLVDKRGRPALDCAVIVMRKSLT